MRFGRSEEEEATISMAPLIDMVFLLLIFFLVTYHFDVASGVSIQLPKVTKKIYEEGESRVTVMIDKSGQTYLEGKKMEMKTLTERLREIVNQQGMVHLVLQADEEARHGVVVQTMDLAKAVGVHSIVIAAQWKPERIY